MIVLTMLLIVVNVDGIACQTQIPFTYYPQMQSSNWTGDVLIADDEFPSRCVVASLRRMENGLLTGSITSYTDPATNSYLPGKFCKAFIHLPFGSTISYKLDVDLEVCKTFITECNCDWLTFGEANGIYCNKKLEGVVTNFLELSFATDGDASGLGFNLTWTEVRSVNACSSEVISATSGFVESPVDSEGRLLPHQLCRWFFKAQHGFVWEFYYSYYSFPKIPNEARVCPAKDQTCACSKFQSILAGVTSNVRIFEYIASSPEYSKWAFVTGNYLHSSRCGSTMPLNRNYTTFTSEANILFMFISISQAIDNSGYGMRIFYQQVPGPCKTTREVTGNMSGIISSDVRPDSGLYRPNENCRWRITTGKKMALKLTFLKWDIDECMQVVIVNGQVMPCDSVTIYDGDSAEDAPIMDSLIRGKKPQPSYISRQPVVIVEFITDNNVEKTGFALHYEGIDSDYIPCETTELLLKDNGTLSNYRRISDGSYRTSEDCSWHLIVESGKRISFAIRQLDIQSYGTQDEGSGCPIDWLAIHDGGSKRSTQLATICGTYAENRTDLNITTSGNEAFISFRTDSENDNSTGFVVDFTSIDVEKVSVPAETSSLLTIILATVIPAVVILILVISSMMYLRKRRLLREHKAEKALECYALSSYICPATNFKSLLIEFGCEILLESIEKLNIKEEQLLLGDVFGHGNFGVVLKGILASHPSKPAQDVAVKIVKSTKTEDCVDLVREAILMADLDHENIMKMLGIAIINETPHVVFPLMANGNLRDFLKNSSKHEKFALATLIGFCRQICSGMCYLSEKGYIHRDLAARNVLVSEQRLLKISDFGLGRCLKNTNYYNWHESKVKAVPIRWHPPESFQAYLFDTKSDVWSFGVLCWEVFTLCETEPYAELATDEIGVFLEKGNRLKKPDICTEEMYSAILLCCWRKNRFQRPTFNELAADLENG